MTMGKVIKCHAVYKTPFWRQNKLSGTSFSIDETIELSVDNSVPHSPLGILTSLIHADRAEFLMSLSAEKRKATILKTYAKRFGSESWQTVFFHDYSFTSDQWTS